MRDVGKPLTDLFPTDRSLGNLYALDFVDNNRLYWIAWMNGWTHIGEARGKALIPSECLLGFQPAPDFGNDDMWYLPNMPRLFRLAFGTGIFDTVRRNTITDDGFAHLGMLSELDSLTIDVSGVSYDGLHHLRNLVRLRHADFGAGLGRSGPGMADGHMPHVANLVGLHTLYLDGTNVTDRSLKYIEPLRDLIALRLGDTRIRGDGLIHLHALRKLEELGLWKTEITDEALPLLAPMSNLRELDLSSTHVTDDGLTHLQALKKLRSLRLQGMTIKNHGLRALESLTELGHLDLGSTGITDSQLDDLPTLPNLTNLAMSWAGITDNGLLSLRRFPNLHSLYLKDTELSDYAVDEMREYYPGIGIYQSQP